ncbi:MAG TPA: FG-GAP-like repeat-containing protein [Thermodesulfobacteriota bacterium]|nr:FG-GAP-like repeat-containing protein [Thermodesulfobacteriota bacterium]
MNVKSYSKLFLLLVLLLLVSPSRAAQQKIKVAIIPFKMNVGEELKYLRDGIMDMLSTRLTQGADITTVESLVVKKAAEGITGELNEVIARRVGSDLGADYVVFGSVTKVMESLSLDGKVLKVQGEEPATQVFTQSSGMDNVIIKISEFSQNIQNAILGKPLITIPLFQPPPQPQVQAQYPQAETAIPPADYFISRKKGRGGEEEEEDGFFVQSAAAKRAQGFWRSQLFETELWGMDIGDVNGDKENEIVLIDAHNIEIYKKAPGKLELVKRVEGKFYEKNLNVDVADLNKNGISEIFVSSIKDEFVNSFVVEFDKDKGEYRRIAENIPWFLKVMDLPGQGLTLLGQKSGTDQAFSGDITQFSYKNGKFLPDQRYDLPRNVTVYGFNLVDIEKTGEKDVLFIDESEYLRIVSPSGELKWKSDDQYGGSDKYFERYFEKDGTSEKNISKKKIYVQPRILVMDTNKDDEKEIIIGRNDSQTGRIFKDTRMYHKSEIQNLGWNGISLVENWRTKKIDGYLSDFQIKDVDNDGENELVVAVILRYDLMQMKTKSTVLIYELKTRS